MRTFRNQNYVGVLFGTPDFFRVVQFALGRFSIAIHVHGLDMDFAAVGHFEGQIGKVPPFETAEMTGHVVFAPFIPGL
ncbi:MAG: hypothetical protein COW30_17625 [Rhodospirillales bacterium CG15_BIG_FIL_POST_REV_8_21_14_020_66_15]|nr:MAG: hypothetical protein COW30_17625 [Rhodospirillales bacterium CG15_BIG_FIL_POST_REV_8_21_14_020_66_15]